MSTALYRRYRPDTFADVIGQEHVTTPLMAALSKNRVNHAYLFSGPRGCGKTTSARILARCLNCAQGPTATPCGECDSCRELATGGSGSLDVIEIDAASHGGVDDARDLRERATFAPVRDRYKIFIIDEAHMVTSAGFNALLKIVEEPPEHIKFIFATTEPDKVIGTIRSRTHHYPFRLVPPEPLMAYLERLCTQENVQVAPGVLSLVIRAGGGSVRDSLSVLDQLMAGAGPDGLDYELAVSLLGYTHASLLDDVVDAMAAQDAATVFSAVDRVIQTGHDPRRFVEDLLERFRDLIIVKAMPESAAQVIRGLPEDQLHRMNQQASLLGHAELSRSADVTNQALTEMTGATSPRLHLELLCARLLLPASDTTERGINARVDRIERRLSYAGDVPEVPSGQPAGTPQPVHDGGASPAAAGFESAAGPQGAAAVREALRAARGKDQPAAAAAPAAELPAGSPTGEATGESPDAVDGEARDEPTTPGTGDERWTSDGPAATSPDAPTAGSPAPEAAPAPAAPRSAAPEASAEPSPDWGGTWGPVDAAGAPASDAPAPASAPIPAAGPAPDIRSTAAREQPPTTDAPGTAPVPAGKTSPADAPPASTSGAAGTVEMFRRAWPEIMDALREEKKFVWLTIQPHASLAGYDGRTLTVAFANPGPMKAFSAKQDNIELLQRSITKVLGLTPEIVITAGGSAPAGGSGPKAERRPAPASRGPVAPPRAEAEPVRPTAAPVADARPTAPSPDQAPTAPPAQQAAAAPAPSTSRGPSAAAAPVPRTGTQHPGTGGPPAMGPAAALRQRRSTTPSAPSNRTTAAPAPAPAEGPTDFGPEPEDDGGYDWGSDNVPVAPWDAPATASAPSGPPAEPPTRGGTDPNGETWQRPAGPAPVEPTGTNRRVAPSPERPAAPAPAGTPAAPAPGAPAAAAPAAPAPGQAAAPAPGAVAPSSSIPSPATPTREAPQPAPGKPMSRYQQLLNQAQAKESGTPGAGTAGPPGGGAAPRRGPADVESTYVEDIPSDDDISIEESGVVGRSAIERLLNGRLIEERNHDGTPVI
ncbi:DNA polymerase III subunit gamma and tau [Arthrobacter sp.]|uniref:DNA polymerase III subunit gamma and tau n=1 Tax=Arthrobacter sp. TaxID=1667 RepID=UPI003A95C795